LDIIFIYKAHNIGERGTRSLCNRIARPLARGRVVVCRSRTTIEVANR